MADDRDGYALSSMVDGVVSTEVRSRWVDFNNAGRQSEMSFLQTVEKERQAMDPLDRARQLAQLAYAGKGSENRQQATLLAIAQALIAIAQELREMNSPETTVAQGQGLTTEGSVLFEGQTVTREDVLSALRDFDAQYPDTNEHKHWLDVRAYKYAVCHEGKQYPPGHILRAVAGSQRRTSVSRLQYERVFGQLGFPVGPKHLRRE